MRVSERVAARGWSAPSELSVALPLGHLSYAIALKEPKGETLDGMAHFEPYLVNEKLYVECTLSSCD